MCEFPSLRHRLLWYRLQWCDGSRGVELLRLLLLHVIETLECRTARALQRSLFSLANWPPRKLCELKNAKCSPQWTPAPRSRS